MKQFISEEYIGMKDNNEEQVYSTSRFQEALNRCGDLDEYQTILLKMENERSAWADKINQILIENNYTKGKLATLCMVSRPAVVKWCEGSLPSRRDDYIRIGFAAHYDLDEMNRFLMRYGKFPALYPKSLEDTVYIFVLNSELYPHSFRFCENTIQQIKEKMIPLSDEAAVLDTSTLGTRIMSLESIQQLEDFIQNNAVSYKDAYSKFYAKVKAFLIANSSDPDPDITRIYSVNFLANMQGWTSSLRQCVSAIRNNKWFPLRRKIIALGLHLNMNVDEINELLELAQMEVLCPKNPVESAIIFAVNEAELNELICRDGGSELCDFVRTILENIGIPEASMILNDL